MTNSTLQELLDEYNQAAGSAIPHYRANDLSRHADNAPEHVATVHAVNGNPLPQPERITFHAPPPLPAEPSFEQRLEPLLRPLRATVDEARQAYERARLEADQRDSMRVDVERAAAAVRNVSTDPPRLHRPDGKTALAMSDADWNAYKARVANGEV